MRGQNQSGFTLVELLIATTVFSVILLAATAALIQVGKLYYKGLIASKTQGVARTVTDNVSRNLQFSNGQFSSAEPVGSPQVRAICVGSTRYTYLLGVQLNSSLTGYDNGARQAPHVLWQDEIGTQLCGHNLPNLLSSSPGGTNGKELMENGMRLQNFSITPGGGTQSDIFNIQVKVLYFAGPDLLDDFDNPTTCKGSIVGGQWCAISDLSTTVYSRAN